MHGRAPTLDYVTRQCTFSQSQTQFTLGSSLLLFRKVWLAVNLPLYAMCLKTLYFLLCGQPSYPHLESRIVGFSPIIRGPRLCTLLYTDWIKHMWAFIYWSLYFHVCLKCFIIQKLFPNATIDQILFTIIRGNIICCCFLNIWVKN